MTRRLVMGILAVAVCLGAGIVMTGSAATAPSASAAPHTPNAVHRARPAADADGCEGKFSALTRGGDVYSYKSVKDRRGRMTGAAENFTQQGETDKNYWFSFGKQFNGGSYEALGVSADGTAYAISPDANYAFSIVKRTAGSGDGNYQKFTGFALEYRNALRYSPENQKEAAYLMLSERIVGGAVNPADNMYYFLAYGVKDQFIGYKGGKTFMQGAYLYRFNETRNRVEFAGWYNAGGREGIKNSDFVMGDIAFSKNGDLYFLYQKASIGTVETKLDFLLSSDLQRIAPVDTDKDMSRWNAQEQIASFERKELPVRGRYPSKSTEADGNAVVPGGWDLSGSRTTRSSKRPGVG